MDSRVFSHQLRCPHQPANQSRQLTDVSSELTQERKPSRDDSLVNAPFPDAPALKKRSIDTTCEIREQQETHKALHKTLHKTLKPENTLNLHETFGREHCGGKGHFLYVMQESKLPVPQFQCVTTDILKTVEEYPVNISWLKKCASNSQEREISFPSSRGVGKDISMAKFRELGDDAISLSDLKSWISTFPPEQDIHRNQCLKSLSEFIASDDFYMQIAHLPVSQQINDIFHSLSADSQPVIVRSSGVTEDNYGDAQAGRFDSVVHQGRDILRSCLQVFASSYRPEACPQGVPPTMAIILQKCIDCRFGGVVMSYTSLKNDTMRVEYTPGQPKGVVAGRTGITPHTYTIDRMEDSFEARFSPGHIPAIFTLRPVMGDEGFEEVEIPGSLDTSGPAHQQINTEQLDTLYRSIQKLENLLFCPVDVEFCIDREGQLYLLQVRPITRLAGGMTFSIAAPSNQLACGEQISEGLCRGMLCSAADLQSSKDSLPEGAIIFADHCQDWMLEPPCLEKAGGFIFRQGGSNDHAAITLRQKGKPCLLSSIRHDQLEKLKGQTVTLGVGQFKGEPGAFLLQYDHYDDLQNHMDLAVTDGSRLLKTPLPQPSPSPDFTRPDTGFRWLDQQNNRLLEYFQVNRILHSCLGFERCVQLSMSSQRVEILARFNEEIKAFLEDLRLFLKGYECFLNLGGSESSEVTTRLNELGDLHIRLTAMEHDVREKVTTIVHSTMPTHTLSLADRDFKQWLASGQALQEYILFLGHYPRSTKEIQSPHQFISYIHKQFVKALMAVALGSGLGRPDPTKHKNFVDFCHHSRGTPKADSELCNKDIEQAIMHMARNGSVLNMPGALICTFKPGAHHSVVEMLEAAEGGKGRTLRLKFSDELKQPHRLQGGLKRFWFLAYALQIVKLGGSNRPLSFTLNKSAFEICFEFSHIPSREMMQESFVKLLEINYGIEHFNMIFSGRLRLDWETADWSFQTVEKRLMDPSFNESNEFAFKFCIFRDAYIDHYNRKKSRFNLSYAGEQYFQLDKWARAAKEMNIEQVDKSLSQLNPASQKEILHLLLLNDPQKAAPLVFGKYQSLFQEKYFLARAVRQNWKVIAVIPKHLITDTLAYIALDQNASALEYAPHSLTDNERLVEELINRKPKTYQYISRRLKSDLNLARLAIQQWGAAIQFSGEKIKNNEYYQRLALENDPMTLEFSSWLIRHDRHEVLKAVCKKPDAIQFADSSLKDDEHFMEPIAMQYPGTFRYASPRLRKDRDLALTLVELDGSLLQYLDENLRDDPVVVSKAIKNYVYSFKHASPRLKDSYCFIRHFISEYPIIIDYCSDSIKDNDEIALIAALGNENNTGVLSDRLKNDIDFMMNIINIHPFAIVHSGDKVKSNKNAVLSAVKNNGALILYADDNLKGCKEVVLAGVQNDPYATIMYADKKFRSDWEVLSVAAKREPEVLELAGEDIKQKIAQGEIKLDLPGWE